MKKIITIFIETMDKLEQSEPHIHTITALKEELKTGREGSRVSLETSNGKVEGKINFIAGDFRSFSMEITGPEEHKGANMEFLLEGAMTGAVPKGVDTRTCMRVTITTPLHTQTFQQWTGAIKNFRVFEH